jgi:peptidoglycan hydrolase-like protein with peptidoglycan-binding domain
VRTLIRKVILGTASVIALGIAGEIASSALDYPADATTATAANMPAPAQNQNPNDALTADPLRGDDIRWAQLELRNRGLYLGSFDGILGPGTRRAVSQFQAINGLGRTATLDTQTWDALTAYPAIGLRSGTPGDAQSSTTSDLSR